MLLPWVHFIKDDEQLLIETFTKRWTVDGPGVYPSMPFQTVKRRKGVLLSADAYLHVRNKLTGEVRVVQGPTQFFLGANEEYDKFHDALALDSNDYLHVRDKLTGDIRLVTGPTQFILGPNDEIVKRGTARSIGPTEYLHVRDQLSGDLRVVYGPTHFILGPFDEVVDNYRALPLKENQYVRILEHRTGEIRVERGEASIILMPTETLLQNVTDGVNIDENTAVLVRDIATGVLSLITDQQVFIPTASQEIVETRPRIMLEDHQTMVILDQNGEYVFRRGTDAESTFFLGPYDKVVPFLWSTGIHKDKRTLQIDRIDSRPKFMWYEFGVRTRDNVELVLGVTFFWLISDVENMVRTTDDAPGDVTSHARSAIIQAVSQVTLEQFLSSFNAIVHQAVLNRDDRFYSDRGIAIHAVEVRSIACLDDGTQAILNEIIQETTNRLNRLQKQQSENEIKMERIRGEIQAEEMRGDLLDLQREHSRIAAQTEGEAEADRVRAFFDGLSDAVALEERVALFGLLRKQEILGRLSEGSAQLYFTPADIDLSIETRTIGAQPAKPTNGSGRH